MYEQNQATMAADSSEMEGRSLGARDRASAGLEGGCAGGADDAADRGEAPEDGLHLHCAVRELIFTELNRFYLEIIAI